MLNSFDKFVNLVLEDCGKPNSPKPKHKKTTKNKYVGGIYSDNKDEEDPDVGENGDVDLAEEGYFNTGNKMVSDIRKLLNNRSHEIKSLPPSASLLSVARENAPSVLKGLKNMGYFTMYRYPVEDPASILVLLNPDHAKKFLKVNPSFVGRYVKY